MNKVILIGNLTRDPEKKSTPNGVSTTSFSVAVQRNYKNAAGGYDADFINCVAWRSTADFIAQYFSKGQKICLEGSIQTRSYDDKNGVKRYVTEVNVDKAEFVGGKAEPKPETKEPEQVVMDGFEDFVPAPDEELPF